MTQERRHDHVFGTDVKTHAERRTAWVVGITAVMMLGEVAAGTLCGSMALLADGWHMGTHAAALGVAWFAYRFARRHAANPRFSFGTGKVGALGGFASAVGLGVVALLILAESTNRFLNPVSIRFTEAMAVAVLGLAVNLGCAWLLGGQGDQHEHDQHEHGEHHHHQHHHDHNLRGAYLHVLADALTSVGAIAALAAGLFLGWQWMDPLVGVAGSLVIARWSLGLLRDTGAVLLDAEVSQARRDAVQAALEAEPGVRVLDLHLWRVGPRHFAATVTLVAEQPQPPDHYLVLLSDFKDIAHTTIEVRGAG
jgi:cation diffusion facilitator family transporter